MAFEKTSEDNKPIKGLLNVSHKKTTVEAIDNTILIANKEALAQAIGVVKVIDIKTKMTYQWQGIQRVIIEGTIIALVHQECGWSLKIIEHPLNMQVYRVYQEQHGDRMKQSKDADMTDIDEEIIDGFNGKTIDIGALVLEELILAVDPYFKSDEPSKDHIEIL